MDKLSPEVCLDRALMRQVERVAATVLERHGDGLAAAERTDGWSNATWLTDRFAIRVGMTEGTTDLLREAELTRFMPRKVGYPETIDVGVISEHEYQLTRRVAGTSLAKAWISLGWDQRADALRQLWTMAEYIHQLDDPRVTGLVSSTSPFYPTTPSTAIESLQRLREAALLTSHQIATLTAQLDSFYLALSDAPPVLNHGDLFIGNAIWDGSEIVSLVDFEFAVAAPIELDLNELVKHAFAPPDTLGFANGDSAGLRTLRTRVNELVAAAPTTPSRADLLTGYSILLETWLTGQGLAQTPPRDIRSTQSYRLLTALAEGDGGYLAPLLAWS